MQNTIQNEIRDIKTLCLVFGVQVVFVNKRIKAFPKKWAGTFIGNTIYLNTLNNIDYMSVFFHELSHIICVRLGRMKFFHSFDSTNETEENISKFQKILPKAEREIDIMAIDLMKRFFPKRRFYGYYL